MSDTRADADTIRALEKQRFCAMRDGDVDVLDALYTDEMCYTHSNATRDTKASLLAKIRDQELRCTDVVHEPEDHVVVIGDTAVATGRVIGTVYVNGIAFKQCNRALAVWTRQGGRWRLIAYQSTPIPPVEGGPDQDDRSRRGTP
ncbi:MAG: nuclear transport factor 2 family protein [Pseudonocardiales bacterium]|nr:nuclear transport factor 2 family protein [Pseudonocardiales bacterium]MBV9032253.1 nuclear transport factor 2 family protein [Pseudonocardiales bacterium]MBW0009083.1 nuclear transport factor 2 family protein [Pseudonocardiales bacterium]